MTNLRIVLNITDRQWEAIHHAVTALDENPSLALSDCVTGNDFTDARISLIEADVEVTS